METMGIANQRSFSGFNGKRIDMSIEVGKIGKLNCFSARTVDRRLLF